MRRFLNNLKRIGRSLVDLAILFWCSHYCPGLFDLCLFGGVALIWYGLSFVHVGVSAVVCGAILSVLGFVWSRA